MKLKYVFAVLAIAHGALAQSSPTGLLVTNIAGITSSWAGECGANTVDNRSSFIRQNLYHSVAAQGTGSWSVTITYSNTSCAGPWTSYGSSATINQSSNPPIATAYDGPFSPAQFINIAITGNAVATYTAEKQLFMPSAGSSSTTFPITVPQGGTGAITPIGAKVNLNVPLYPASDYNFPSQTPGGSLTAHGVGQPITLTPCPLGIVASGVWAPVYLSGGTGSSEGVTPTGGTCTSGGSSGTILVTPNNAHSGAWTVTSATGGVMEAVNAGVPSIYIPSANPVTFHAKVTVGPGQNVTFYGDSKLTAAVIRASDYQTGDLFYGASTSYSSYASFSFVNLNIANVYYTGTAIHNIYGAVYASGLFATDGVLFNLDSVGNYQIEDFDYYSGATGGASPARAIYINSTSANSASTNGRISNGNIIGNWSGAGIELTGVDSLDVDFVTVDGMQKPILIDPPTGGSYITNVRIHNCEIDAGSAANVTTRGIQVIAQSTVIIGSVSIEGNDFLGYNTSAEAYAIDVGESGAGYFGTFKIEGNSIFNWNVGIGIGACGFGGCQSMIVSGNSIGGNISHGLSLNSPVNTTLTGNVITGNGGYGIQVLNENNATNDQIVGNNLLSNTSGPVSFQYGGLYYPVPFSFSNNLGIDSVIGTVASTGALLLPVNPYFTITGTTGVTSLGGCWSGKAGSFPTPSGAVTLTAGTGIGNTITTTQNVPVSYWCDASGLVWMH